MQHPTRPRVCFVQDADMFWDFISLRPETTHQVLFLFADRGTPDGFRHMNGYGSHTFKLVNAQGQGSPLLPPSGCLGCLGPGVWGSGDVDWRLSL